ncbi:hypothetical protein [Kushneria phosphatilytica]|uniref:Uncharacterized protein n=1 Tax=Kushneria phosphatilytica TaxID=657387 RepID=A0A1S1P0Z3_9GAMM|nr:hypothetical protein [Kushneria phosphatilytica]OHV12145.1 hypothetical protein BH688_05690 [Kushneria phosphatilytica]QEL11337.1 hypothetical protein FY550_09425 [Kushneria phosphatilytica]
MSLEDSIKTACVRTGFVVSLWAFPVSSGGWHNLTGFVVWLMAFVSIWAAVDDSVDLSDARLTRVSKLYDFLYAVGALALAFHGYFLLTVLLMLGFFGMRGKRWQQRKAGGEA